MTAWSVRRSGTFFRPAGLCVFRTTNVIAGRIGHPTGRHAAFGLTAARLDDVFALLPAAISGGVLVLASLFVPAASPSRAMSGWIADLGPGALSGRGRGAMVGALGLAPSAAATGGAAPGAGTGRATARDVGRAMLMVIVASLIAATAIAGLALLTAAR
jgi:adenosylcobinamide-phosphate synthase